MVISVLEVVVKDGSTVVFIPHEELLQAGYMSLEDFDVVEANERYYELQGYDQKTGLWWVEQIKLPEDDAGQGMETMGEGGSEGPGRDA